MKQTSWECMAICMWSLFYQHIISCKYKRVYTSIYNEHEYHNHKTKIGTINWIL